MSTAVFQVPEMSCAHCKATIEKALSEIDGVRDAVADVEVKSVSITYESVERETLQRAIESAGYGVTGVA